jgi:hypothetical protein
MGLDNQNYATRLYEVANIKIFCEVGKFYEVGIIKRFYEVGTYE